MADSWPASAPAMTASSVARTIRKWFVDHGIAQTGVLVGVSGGADSVGLLRAMDACRGELSLDVCAAHVNHQLRADSDADADWVRRLCDDLRLPAIIETIDVPALADGSGRGIEETARDARFQFFREAAADRGCSHVAVAHTADDQAETILHHLIRGTGLAGLRGMPAFRSLGTEITLIRPLLNTSRAALLRSLDELGQPYRVDASNDDERFTRNRLRHTLLPLLRDEFNPRVSDVLARLSRQVDEVQQIIEALAGELLDAAIIGRQSQRAVLRREPLQGVQRHLVREALRLLWTRQNWPRQRMGYDDWDRAAALIQTDRSHRSLDLPHHIRICRRGNRIELTQSPAGMEEPE